MGRLREVRHAQRIAVHVGVIRQEAGRADRQRRVLDSRVTVIHRHRRVVDRRDGDRDRRHCRGQFPVGRPIGEGVESGVVQTRCVGERAVVAQAQRAVQDVRHQHRCQRVAIHVAVVRQNSRRRNRQRRVFHRRVSVIHRDRRVVHRNDGDGDDRHAARQRAVRRAIGEGVRAGVVQAGRVSERTAGRKVQRAVRDVRHEHRSERVAIHVAVIRQHAERGNGQQRVFVHRVRIVDRHRPVVHGRDGDGHGRHARCERAVRRPIREGVQARVVQARRVSERAVGRKVQRAVRDVGHEHG